MKTLIAGNWKMNGMPQDVRKIHNIRDAADTGDYNCELLICPQAALIMQYSAHSGDNLAIGAQDCHYETSGAFTGDHSAELLKASGATYVIIGHSERRAGYEESSQIVAQKAKAAIDAGITPIICIGETKAQREAGEAFEIVLGQLTTAIKPVLGKDYVIAYEPVWAIGTGNVASAEDVTKMHDLIREKLVEIDAAKGSDTRILYGGSMKPNNAEELLAIENVNGGLIGGASLVVDDFLAIAKFA